MDLKSGRSSHMRPLASAPAIALGLLLSAVLAFPVSAHAAHPNAGALSKPRLSAVPYAASKLRIAQKTASTPNTRAWRHSRAVSRHVQLATSRPAGSGIHTFTACHRGCDACTGCAHCTNSCGSSSCSGWHAHAFIAGPNPGHLAAMWRFAAPALDPGPDGLAPIPQFKPPRA